MNLYTFALRVGGVAFVALLFTSTLLAEKKELCTETINGPQIGWTCNGNVQSLTLTVTGPDDMHFRQTFEGRTASFNVPAGMQGSFNYDLVLTPQYDAATRAALDEARKNNDTSIVRELKKAGKVPADTTFAGTFEVQSGGIVPKTGVEATARETTESSEANAPSSGRKIGGHESASRNIDADAQVIADTLIVQQSACFGIDCSSGESFGADTIRLKENNLRINFEDTSVTPGSYAHTDWRIYANDQNEGGANYFSIEDATNSKTPFKIEANVTTNLLYLDDSGRIGVKTTTPAKDIQITTSDTPAIRLDQTNAQWAAKYWDIGGNEANFFIRDGWTGGLTFRILSADENTMVFSGSNVGIGHASPSVKLHVKDDDGSTQLRLEETSGTTQSRELVQLLNNGRSKMRFNTSAQNSYIVEGPDSSTNTLNIYKDGDAASTRVAIGSTAATTYALHVTGNAHVTGNLTSSNVKAGIITAASFTDRQATVTFTSAFADANYAIALTAITTSGNLISFSAKDKSATGFTVVAPILQTAGGEPGSNGFDPMSTVSEINWTATKVTQ